MSNFPELPQAPRQKTFDRVVREAENPLSLVERVSPEVARAIMKVPEQYLDKTEEEVEKLYSNIEPTTIQIRRLFWLEYDRSIELGQSMDMSRCYTGVCTKLTFQRLIERLPDLVWIITPPKDYIIEVEDLLAIGLKQVREILQLPNKNGLGFIDAKLVDCKLKAILMLDLRLKGGHIARSMQITHNVNENRNRVSSDQFVQDIQVDPALALDQKLAALELEISQAKEKAIELKPSAPLQDLQKNRVAPHVVEAAEDAIEADFTESKE